MENKELVLREKVTLGLKARQRAGTVIGLFVALAIWYACQVFGFGPMTFQAAIWILILESTTYCVYYHKKFRE